MAVSRALRRLLRIRGIEEEQSPAGARVRAERAESAEAGDGSGLGTGSPWAAAG